MNNECSEFHCLTTASGILAPLKGNGSIGFSLIEMLLVVAIVGTLSGIAVPVYTGYREKVDSQRAIADIVNIEIGIERYYYEHGRYPDSLAEIGMDGLRDPWDRPYQFQRHPDNSKSVGDKKKLTSTVPINNDYDLWSNGQDGRTNQALTTQMCRDDIIRAFDGAYIGPVKGLI